MATISREPGQTRYATLNQQEFTYDPSTPQRTPSGTSDAEKPRHGMSGAKRDIYLALACILIPMLGLSGLIVGLVFGYQVERNHDPNSPLALTQKSDTDNSAYYVHINSTTFATIASWSSTVAPLLVMAAMSLAAFPVARKLKDSSSTDSTDLPTPYQLSLLLESLTGGIAPVWNLLRYRRWEHRQHVASLVRSPFVFLLIATFVGYTVAGIDTWLHLVMDTVEIHLISTQDAGQHTFGRGIENPGCSNQPAQEFDVTSCTVSLAVTGTFLTGGNQAFRTLANLSDMHTVSRAEIEDHRQLAYLGPARVDPNIDFQARTLAMHTQCTPIGAKCDLHVESGASEPFHCSDSFYGDLPSRMINGETTDPFSGQDNQNTGVIFFEDEDLTILANTSFRNQVQNPYYLGVWAYVGGLTFEDDALADGNIVVPGHGGLTWLLSCKATAYEMTYSWTNGSVTVNELTQSNGTMGTIINSPIYYGFGRATMESNALAATANVNAAAVANAWAYLYSRTVMALIAGATEGRLTTLEHVREPVLVARIPKVPLYMLVAFNCLYGILGIVLAILAFMTKPGETNDVRERISIAGIVASNFEGSRASRPVNEKRELFAEYSGSSSAKVGVERSQSGGWEYTLRDDTKQIA